MVIRIVLEIKKTAVKSNKPVAANPHVRTRLANLKIRSVSTSPSRTSVTPSILAISAATVLHIAVQSYQ